MIMTNDGLDLNFCETKRSLNIPVNSKVCGSRKFSADPMFDKIGNVLSDIDYQQYLTRFKWYNLPNGLDSELMERILYFSGSAMFFYLKDIDKFLFLPYGMSSDGVSTGIDFYGRFKKLKPYSFNGSTEQKKKVSSADIYLSSQIRDNIIDVPMVETEEEAKKIYENGAVICWDHTPGLAYFVDCRNRTSKPFIEYIIKVLIQTKSALINSSGFNMFSTATESAVEILQELLDQINRDREAGKLSAVVSDTLGNIENLQSNAPAAMQDFWASLQSVDNLRLKTMGISNDGVQQKSQYMNIQEQSMDINDAMQVYWNCFMERVKFAAIVNSIWGLDIYPEPTLMPQQEQGQEDTEEEGGDKEQAQEGTNEN